MTVTTTSLRAAFPEFLNTTTFPDAQINFWIPIFSEMVGQDRWGDMTDLGVTLAICHQLTLSARAVKTATIGGIPGMATGVVSGKSVDKVSVEYDTKVSAEEGAGFWNQTTYGQRYWHFAQLFGAGPVQCGTPGCGPEGAGSGAWPGPLWPVF